MTASSPQKSASKRKSASKPKSSPVAKTPIKTSKKAKTSNHPKFIDMISEGLQKLDEKTGSSRQAILKFIVSNYPVDPKLANQYLKIALKNGVKSGVLKQLKGVGASGSFKLAEKVVKSNRPVIKLKKENVSTAPQKKKSQAKKSTKIKTLTKEAAAAQLPSATTKGRKPPTVREQIVEKKSRATKASQKKAEPAAPSSTEIQPEIASVRVEEKKAEPEKQVRVSARRAAEAKSKKSNVATRGKKKEANATQTIQA